MKGLRTLLAFLPAFVWGHESYCQDTTSKFSVAFSPAILIPITIAAQLGVQYKLTHSWSLAAEIAVPTFYPEDTGYDELMYLRIGTELKFKPYTAKALKRYFAFQTTYLFREFVDKGPGVFQTKESTFGYNSAGINSPVLASAFKLGFEAAAGKKIYFDLFTGLGVRFVFTKYTAENVFAAPDQPRGGFALVPESAWRYNYTLPRFHFTSGLKVGMRL